jgi:hypothetical protein
MIYITMSFHDSIWVTNRSSRLPAQLELFFGSNVNKKGKKEGLRLILIHHCLVLLPGAWSQAAAAAASFLMGGGGGGGVRRIIRQPEL